MLDARFVAEAVRFFPEDVVAALGTNDGNAQFLGLFVRTGWYRWRNFMPSQLQLAPILVASGFSGCATSLMRSLSAISLQLDLFGLDPLEHAPLIKQLADRQPYATNMQIKVDGSFDDYWNNRSRNLRKNIARYRRRLHLEFAEVEFPAITAIEDISLAVDRYGLLESKGWKAVQATALHPGNIQGQFYRQIMRRFAETGDAMVFECRINGRLTASRLLISSPHMGIILKTTYDEQLREFALGKAHLYELLEFLFRQRMCGTIDFYTNARKEQLDWATDQRTMLNGTIFRNTPIHLLNSAARQTWHRLRPLFSRHAAEQ